ncbi:MAG: hypothetical protein ABI901_04570 [Roseiflexaceae bacterium]
MHRCSTRPLHLIIMLLLIILPIGYAAPARAAEPGEELINSTGVIGNNETHTVTIYSPGSANLRLEIGGGAATDKLTLTLLASGGATIQSWDVQSGEVAWVSAELPAGGAVSLHNTGSAPLSYKLTAYALGVVPNITSDTATWGGIARGNGIHSTIRVNVPGAGRYRFTLGASGGSFQINVDNGYLLKTVDPSSAPNPDDSTYYLDAGVHSLTIMQATGAALTTWSAALAAVGGLDELPSAESSAVLGGGSFSDEWIPVQIQAGAQVNLNITATGAATNSLVVSLYNSSRATPVFTSTTIYGGETVWGSGALADGANALHIVAAGSGSLAYTITVSGVAPVPTTLTGISYGAPAHASGGNSTALLTFPAAGLYSFTLGASAGRYQILLNSNYLKKTVTSAGATFTAYVPAGTYPIVVAQDPAAASTSWSVAVVPTNTAVDSLPYSRSGGTLGGPNNAFTEEWLPIQAGAGVPVNLKVSVAGVAADALQIELYKANSADPPYRIAKVYGSEIGWGSAALANGTNLLHIIAPASNSGMLDYQIDIKPIDAIPGNWSGTSLSAGLNSTLRVSAPVAGTYNVTVTVAAGTGQVLIDATASAKQGIHVASSTTVLRVPLSAGLHTFTFQQDAGQPVTSWEIAATLRSSDTRKVFVALLRR